MNNSTNTKNALKFFLSNFYLGQKIYLLAGSSNYLDISKVAVLNADSGTGINSSSRNIGGILGSTGSTNTITDSYAILPVKGSSNVGGLVGNTSARPTITRCYFVGTVTGNSY